MRLIVLVLSLGILCSCGGGPARPTPPTPVRSPSASVDVDAPSITAISPAGATAGSSDITVRITGSNFKGPDGQSPNGTFALWVVNGDLELDSRFVSGTELTAVIPAVLLHDPVAAKIAVVTGDPMAWTDGYRRYPRSNALDFAVSPSSSVGVVYSATFTASPSCASELPVTARERTYTATMFPDGNIRWTGPTVNPPSGHRAISSGKIDGNVLSFSIDVDRDPQSDDFHGIWDDMGNGTTLNISGKGTGRVNGVEITGRLNGLIAFYEPVVPVQSGVLITGRDCQAADHAFRFVRE